jgi:hypothetical protein
MGESERASEFVPYSFALAILFDLASAPVRLTWPIYLGMCFSVSHFLKLQRFSTSDKSPMRSSTFRE